MKHTLLILLCILGLASCASWPGGTPEMVVPQTVDIKRFTGDVVDAERLSPAYASMLSANTYGEIVVGSNAPPLWNIHPSVKISRGGIGVMTVVTIDIKDSSERRSIARRSYTGMTILSSENRDDQVEVLLHKSVPFVQETLRRFRTVPRPAAR